MTDAFESRLSDIDSAQETQQLEQQKLEAAFGKVAVGIEVIATEEAIQFIRQDNPNMDHSAANFNKYEALNDLYKSLNDAIAAKKAWLIANYLEQKSREKLLKED